MIRLFRPPARDERGQVLVIVAAGLIVMIALVGVVIDGGYAWGQQRQVQNGADSMALAGATILAERLSGAMKTDGDVGCAVATAAAANNVSNPVAYYTDITGSFLNPSVQVGPCNPGGGAAIPGPAAGVKGAGDRTFPTYLARVIGFSHFTTSATATAVAGILKEICPADSGCAVLPVTFPINISTCDGTSQIQIGSAEWPLVDPAQANASNESIVPICKQGPGAVGWLDFGCGNLASTIDNPCNISIPIPTWLHTQPGNANNLDGHLSAYYGTTVLIPINDNTCNSNPDSDGLPPDPTADDPNCPGNGDNSQNGSGNGNNFFYHIPKFAGFLIDKTYTSGNNNPECNQAPGKPFVGGNGSTGCFKGWFVKYVTEGPVGPGASGPQDPGVVGVQLIR